MTHRGCVSFHMDQMCADWDNPRHRLEMWAWPLVAVRRRMVPSRPLLRWLIISTLILRKPQDDSRRQDIRSHEPSHQHEARPQIQPTMTHIGWDRTDGVHTLC